MNEDEYIAGRLDDQIRWYSKKSAQNQKWFKKLQITSIIASAFIPFLSGYITETSIILKVITGIMGLLVAAITATLSLYKFQENWLMYRTTCESLKHEKYLFLTRTDPYHVAEPFPLLVQRVESLISKENTNWSRYMKKIDKKEVSNSNGTRKP